MPLWSNTKVSNRVFGLTGFNVCRCQFSRGSKMNPNKLPLSNGRLTNTTVILFRWDYGRPLLGDGWEVGRGRSIARSVGTSFYSVFLAPRVIQDSGSSTQSAWSCTYSSGDPKGSLTSSLLGTTSLQTVSLVYPALMYLDNSLSLYFILFFTFY